MIYVDGHDTTAENEARLAEFTTQTHLKEAELTDPHEFAPIAHTGSALAKKAAIATCSWPNLGYLSDSDEASARLVQFINGVAAAAETADH